MNKKLGGGILAVIVAIGIKIAIGLGLGSGIGFLSEKAKAPDVGDCVVVTGPSSSPEVKKKACGSETLWKVASDDGKCDELEVSYTVTVTGAKAVNLCLEEDAAVGECLQINPDDPNVLDKQVACTAAPAAGTFVVKVTKVDTTTADLKCGKRELPLPNKTRHTSMCIGRTSA
ncbi:LppU/SCO3897 family protein [Nocardioides jiangxiensis]|uniref:Uncharacterized protein n=1 Tax=Nocardioides jiangxiensis TaxID=3064524 RepID=A0ABT9B1Z6_9ACTN|nr:hypothetical protein [Nocardioides sp. WY-20]MDO7868780.1 hypothetical protein [Nocardioides sp. WY-20]